LAPRFGPIALENSPGSFAVVAELQRHPEILLLQQRDDLLQFVA
jgi:hypothetical protein